MRAERLAALRTHYGDDGDEEYWAMTERLRDRLHTCAASAVPCCPFDHAALTNVTPALPDGSTAHRRDFDGNAAVPSPVGESAASVAAANPPASADEAPAKRNECADSVEAATVGTAAAGLLVTTSGEVTLEQLWARLVKDAVPAAASIAWPPLKDLYHDVMGGGYKDIVQLRHDVKTDAKRLCARGVVALAEIEWRNGCAARWSGLFGAQSTGVGLLRLSTACNPPFARGGGSLPAAMRGAALVAGSLKDANLFPCVASALPPRPPLADPPALQGRATRAAPYLWPRLAAASALPVHSLPGCMRLPAFTARAPTAHIRMCTLAWCPRGARSCVALKFPRGHGGAPSANLLFAAKKTGQSEDHFFAHAVCTAVTEKTPFLMKPMLDALRACSVLQP